MTQPLGSSAANRWQVSETKADLVRAPRQPVTVVFAAKPQKLRIDLSRSALIVIDMQNDFCAPGGWLTHIGVDITPARRPIFWPAGGRTLARW